MAQASPGIKQDPISKITHTDKGWQSESNGSAPT
jgi:hypothetical protein